MGNPRRRRWAGAAALTAATVAAGLALAPGCRTPHSDPAWRAELTRVAVAPRPAAPRAPPRLRWERRAQVPAPYREANDLASTPRGLAIASSVDPLTSDGAAIHLLTPSGKLEALMEWDGQGFLSLSAWAGRLFVADSDAPFRAVEYLAGLDVDGYVFVSDAEGRLDERTREVLPASYHVFDTALLPSGLLVASAGAYLEGETAYFSEWAPAVLFGDAGAGRPWRRLLELPGRDARGVSRFTWLLALPDGALLAGIQTSRPDLPRAVRIRGLPDSPAVEPIAGLADAVVRWMEWGGRVYAVCADGAGGSSLLASADGGQSFAPLPEAPGRPQALAALGDELFLLAGGAPFRSSDGIDFLAAGDPAPGLALAAPRALSRPALVAHAGTLWAASPATGEILEAVEAR